MTQSNNNWWRTATFYQIYPKSFCDTTGRGTGDIQGIISKLDYLQDLGVEALWITPMYVSPQVDNGYDIADYYNIDPLYGTMADFDELLTQAHQHNIKIVMDIVVNHTSTEHAWFKDALNNPESPYRDYYIWKDGINGQAPNNWISKFGGSAWQKEETSDQYYLHLFAKEQADLNWENPAVRTEVKKIISFWAEKGVDGFRLDVINLISKDQSFPNDDIGDGRRFYTDGPRIHEYLQEISRDVFQKYGSVTVGEMSSTSIENCQQYSNKNGKELSMVFNFHHLKVDYTNGDKWTEASCDFIALKQLFNEWQTAMHDVGWNALFWCNHDQPRIVTRFGDDKNYRRESATMLAAMIHFMQGSPYIYQGEEIGTPNPYYHTIEQYQDVESQNMFRILCSQGMSEEKALAILAQKSRDNSRTPMQWNNSAHAGFTTGTPWLEVGTSYKEVNVEAEIASDNSVFAFYQQLIKLRQSLPIIAKGDYHDLAPDNTQVFCYERHYQEQRLTILGNFYGEPCTYSLKEHGELLVNNYSDYQEVNGEIILKPYQVLVFYTR